jgi:cobalt-zinc-cadmium efflux system outer membrane protein
VRLAAALALSIPCVGCASTSARNGFDATAETVEARSGHRIAWNQGTEDDEKVRQAVQKLLAADLRVEGAVQIALLNNHALQAEYEELSVAQADVVQAGLLSNPVFSAGMTTAEADRLEPNLQVGITQSFLDLLFLPARKKVAAAQFEGMRLRVADAVLDMAARVRRAYFRFQAAENVGAMRRAIGEAGKASIDLAGRQYEAGNINDLDLRNQQATFEQLQIDVARSEAEITGAREELAQLLGVWGTDVLFKIPQQLSEIPKTEIPLEHLESAAVAHRLDLQAARQQVQTLSYATSLARSSRWTGSIDVGADVARLNDGHIAVGPRASLELPIFDQRQAVVARLDARLRASQHLVSALAVDIRSEVRAARARMLSARQIAERYRATVIPLREDVVRLSEQQYNAMLLGVFQCLAAKQSAISAYREYLESVRDYWIARADLERAVGGRLPGATPPISSPVPGPAQTPSDSEHHHHH